MAVAPRYLYGAMPGMRQYPTHPAWIDRLDGASPYGTGTVLLKPQINRRHRRMFRSTATPLADLRSTSGIGRAPSPRGYVLETPCSETRERSVVAFPLEISAVMILGRGYELGNLPVGEALRPKERGVQEIRFFRTRTGILQRVRPTRDRESCFRSRES